MVLAAAAQDGIDAAPCSAWANAGDCPLGNVGFEGIYFSFDGGASWSQPTYAGLTRRNCVSTGTCELEPGPIGTVPHHEEVGVFSSYNSTVAFGPQPGPDGTFDWANGTRLYHAHQVENLAAPYGPGTDSVIATAVSVLDGQPALTATVVADPANWSLPVLATDPGPGLGTWTPFVWADNAATSPYFGTVYVCDIVYGETVEMEEQVVLDVSTDGGETWTHAIVPGGELLGEDFCHVRTDSRGTVHLFWEATYEDGKALWYSRSDDRGANFSDPSLLGSHLGCYPTGNEIDFGPMDGILGAVAYTYPSIDIANGAPNGDDATDRMVMVTCENTGGAQAATLRESLDRGATWSAPSVVSEPADRVAMPSVAISPDGAALYLVYLAFLDPWRSTTDEPRRVQAVARRATTGDPGSWSTAYRGSVGDARGSAEPNYDIAEESFALHLDAVAARDGGAFVWTDVRNASVCGAINAYRETTNDGQTPDPPAPAAECAASFGNTDIYATTIGSPVQSLRPVSVVKDSARPGVMSS